MGQNNYLEHKIVASPPWKVKLVGKSKSLQNCFAAVTHKCIIQWIHKRA